MASAYFPCLFSFWYSLKATPSSGDCARAWLGAKVQAVINAIITVTQIYLCKLIEKIIPLFGMIDKVTGAQDYRPSPTILNGVRK